MRTCTVCGHEIKPVDCQPRDTFPPDPPTEEEIEACETCEPGIDFCCEYCFEQQRGSIKYLKK